MTVYQVEYATSDYSSDRKNLIVVASNAVRAAEFVSKRKYTSYGGRVTSVREVNQDVQIAR